MSSGEEGEGWGSPSDPHEQTSGVKALLTATEHSWGLAGGSALPAANESGRIQLRFLERGGLEDGSGKRSKQISSMGRMCSQTVSVITPRHRGCVTSRKQLRDGSAGDCPVDPGDTVTVKDTGELLSSGRARWSVHPCPCLGSWFSHPL